MKNCESVSISGERHCGMDYGESRTRLWRSRVEILMEFLVRRISGSGGVREVESSVRIRKLLTRASGTLLASRLRRNKIWDFGRLMHTAPHAHGTGPKYLSFGVLEGLGGCGVA